MRRLLTLTFLIGLFASVGCGKDDKVIPPKDVPPPPTGPPSGVNLKPGNGPDNKAKPGDIPSNKAGAISP